MRRLLLLIYNNIWFHLVVLITAEGIHIVFHQKTFNIVTSIDHKLTTDHKLTIKEIGLKRKWNKFLNCFYYFKLWTSFYRLQQAFLLHTILFSSDGYIKITFLLHPFLLKEFNVFLISNFPSIRKHLLILPPLPPKKMIPAKVSLQKRILQNVLKIPFLQNTSVRLLRHNKTVMHRKTLFFEYTFSRSHFQINISTKKLPLLRVPCCIQSSSMTHQYLELSSDSNDYELTHNPHLVLFHRHDTK